jgi:hypothetical protein
MAVISWMLTWFSLENTATMGANNCLTCQRFYDDGLYEAARPICVKHTYQFQRAYDKYVDGHPPEYGLPTWDPLACGVRLEK